MTDCVCMWSVCGVCVCLVMYEEATPRVNVNIAWRNRCISLL